MAGIAGGDEIAIGLGKHRAVFRLHGLGDRYDRVRCIEDKLDWNAAIEVCRLFQACPDLIELVGRKLRVGELACEPEP